MFSRTLLTDAEEQMIVNHIISAQRRRLPVTKDTIMSLVSSFVSDKRNLGLLEKNNNKFGKVYTFIPGDGELWYRLFLKRHPNIVTRTGESLSGSSRNVSQQDVKQWFADVRSYLGENDSLDILCEAKRNYNVGELWFGVSPIVSNACVATSGKEIDRITIQNEDNEMDRVTVLANTGADGSHPPPLIIYPTLRVPVRVYDSLPTTLASIGKSESGQMNNDLLYKYLCGGFDEWLTYNKIQRPVIVWVDKHELRIQYHLVKRLAELQIILILIPPNASHFMQPIDVGMLTPMKKAWVKRVKDFRASNPNECVTAENFARVFLPMYYVSVMSKDKIKDAFRVCGIHPFDVEAPDYSKLSLKEKHSSDTDSSEVMEQNGMVERGTQMIPVQKLNAASQTRSTQSCESNRPLIYSMKEVAMRALGVQKQIISKGCDDSVLCSPRFEALLCNKRENWFQFVLESDLDSIGSRPRTEAIIDLPKDSEPTTPRTDNIVKEFMGEPIDLNWKDFSFSYSIKTQDNLTIEWDQDDEIDRGDEEPLEPSTEMDVNDMPDQVGEIVHMELLEPLSEIADDLPDVKDEINDEELLANSHEIDDDADEKGESLKHSYPPKSSKSHIGMEMIQIENGMENHGKLIHLNFKEPPLTSSELKLKKVKKEEDIEIVDEPNDLNCKEDPPPIIDPKHETTCEFTEDIKEQMETLSRSTRKGLESQYSINDASSGSKRSRCTGIDYASKESVNLTSNIKAAQKEIKSFKCSKCNHSFTQKTSLVRHKKSVHDKIKPFKCFNCNHSFSIKSELLRHIKSVHGKRRPFKCLECNLSFSLKINLVRHKKSSGHDKIKPFKCLKCNTSFSHKGNLTIHMKTIHEKIISFKCLECHYSSHIKGNLAKHIKSVHEKIKPFKCSVCNKSFSQKVSLVRHTKSVHEKIKPFKCSECNLLFSDKYNLAAHMMSVHEKIKPFKCLECNTSFSQKGSLTTHMKSVHEKIIPFKCSECNLLCSDKYNLAVHMVSVHEKIKPFKCLECNTSFSQKGSLTTHMKSVHEKIKSFKCS